MPGVVHPVVDLAYVEVEPKPWGAQLGLGGEEGMVLGVEGPVEEVGDQGEGRNLEEEDLGGGVPLEADRTDQGREQGEEACRHDLEDQREEGGDPGQEVEVLEGQGDQVDREGDVGDPASHLKSKHKGQNRSVRDKVKSSELFIYIFMSTLQQVELFPTF